MSPDPLSIKLDWAAYWREFQAMHGGDPVPYRGRLLFRDGWTYSATDHAGPEWPPPTEPAELAKLRREYWLAHRSRVIRELSPRERFLDGLKVLQRSKSATLMASVLITGEDGKAKAGSAPLDLMSLEARIDFLRTVKDECDRELSAISLEVTAPLPAITLPPVRWAEDAAPVETIAGDTR